MRDEKLRDEILMTLYRRQSATAMEVFRYGNCRFPILVHIHGGKNVRTVRRKLSRYLKSLIKAGMVERIFPYKYILTPSGKERAKIAEALLALSK